MQNIKTVCSYCGVGCGVDINIEKNKLSGTKEHFTNSGKLCSKGASQLKYISKNRLLKPMFRENIVDEFKEISWESAINKMTRKIKDTEPNKTGFYLSGQLLNEDYYLANKLAKGFIKTNLVDTNSRTCVSSAVVGYKKTLGLDYVPVIQEDAVNSDLYILIGANIAESHIVFSQKIKEAKKRGLKIIVIDPRNTKTSKLADLHISIKAGKDLFFLQAVSKRLFELKQYQPNIKLVGLTEYIEKIKGVDISESLKIAEVSENDFSQFIKMWLKNENIVTSWTMGINQSVNGVAGNIAIINLHLLTGKMFKPKNGAFSLTGQPNAMGGREVGGLATTLAVHLDYNPENIKKVENFWKTENMPTENGLTAFELIEKGNLDFLLIAHTDPVYHLPNRNIIEKKISEIDFVVEINAYTNSETSKFANLILPASPFGEKCGTQTNMDRVVNLQNPISPKSGESLQDWEIFAKIGCGLGFEKEFAFDDSEAVFEEYKEMTKLSPDIDIWKTSYTDLNIEPYRWGSLHKIETANLIFPEFTESSDEVSEEFPLQLLTGRVSNTWHSGTRISSNTDYCEISKNDSEKFCILDKDKIQVISPYGKIEIFVKVSESVKDGTIFIPMHFRAINYLTNSDLDKFSKEPEYKAFVKILGIDSI